MGNALLIQFPDLRFRLIPFISTVKEASRVVDLLDEAVGAGDADRVRRGGRRDSGGAAQDDVPADPLLRSAHQPSRVDPGCAREGRTLSPCAADSPLRRRRLRGDVHHRHRVRLPGRRVHHVLVGPRGGRGAGGGEPRRVLRVQARRYAPAAPPSSSVAWAPRPRRWCRGTSSVFRDVIGLAPLIPFPYWAQCAAHDAVLPAGAR
jgi:hypothetical protein